MTAYNTDPTNKASFRFEQSRGIVLGQAALEGIIDVLPSTYVQRTLGELALDHEGEMAISYTQGHHLARMLLAPEKTADTRVVVNSQGRVSENLRKTVVLHGLLRSEIRSEFCGEARVVVPQDLTSEKRYALYEPLEGAIRDLVAAAHSDRFDQPKKWDAQSLAEWYDEKYPAVNNPPVPADERVLAAV